jgi:exoribonuclease R
VVVAGFEKPILIQSRSHLNRTIHEDVVVIQIFPKEQWKRPSENLVKEEEEEEGKLNVHFREFDSTDSS